jgi:6-phosphogluconolactonase (cycloisomerase 2 family)
VSAFAVSSTGLPLTEIANSPFPTGGTGNGVAFFHAANAIRVVRDTLYVSNAVSHDISAFAIDPNTGELSPVAGSPFSVTGSLGPLSLAATPDGKFLYAGDLFSGNLFAFSIGANGALSPLPALLPPFPVAAGGSINGLTTTPGNGKFLVVALVIGKVAIFAIDPAAGTLTPVAGSPFATPSGYLGPADLDCNCAGNLLFVAGGPTTLAAVPQVAVYSIDATGVLAQINGSPFMVPGSLPGTDSSTVLLSPDETKLFVGNEAGRSIDVFTVAPSGALTPVAGSPFTIDAFPLGMGTDPTGSFLFAGNQDIRSVISFSIAANGVLSLPFEAFLPSSAEPLYLAVYPAKTCCAAPVISGVSASPASLWPPNIELVPVTVDYSVAETCPGTCVLTVASSEPDGTLPEWEVIDSHHVMLRAERLGDGPGRVYTITITCTNNAGGLSSVHSVTVVVPHDQSY